MSRTIYRSNINQKKHLGKYINWFVCPSCGYREHPKNTTIETHTLTEFIQTIKTNNKGQTWKQHNS